MQMLSRTSHCARPSVTSLILAQFSALAFAQQTGTVIARTPGAAIGSRITSTAVVPVASCNAPAISGTEASDAPLVPEMVFSRSWGELVCVRHKDGRTEQLRSDSQAMLLSADGTLGAYWIPEKHELHVVSILPASHSDTVLEVMPGAIFRNMVWSAKGHTLAYFASGAATPGVRAVDLDTGKRQIFSGSFVSLAASSDAGHIIAVGGDEIDRFALEGGQREVLARVKYALSAEYSQNGALLGVLANEPVAAANATPAPSGTPESSADDDTPDCTGGALYLILQDTQTKRLIDVPFPKGFDTVLDFAFSPDERSIAATFGVVGCDYPGDRAQIFLVSLPALKLTPISPEDRLSVEPHWTPDGKSVVYVDYAGSPSPLIAIDLQTRKVKRLTRPDQYFGPDKWVAWR